MPQSNIEIRTPDGTCGATLSTPEGTGRWPAVIMFPDAGGLRDTFQDMGGRLAELGYVTLVPNVYYRLGYFAPFDMHTVFADEAERERLMSVLRSVTPDKVRSDAGAYLDYLTDLPEVIGTQVGTTGYCMGGRISLLVAGMHPERVGVATSFHGGNIAAENDPGSPHLLAPAMTASVYVAGAEEDASFPPEQRERLDQALTAAGVQHVIETYPARHGFAVPDNPTYDAAADERHWAAMERAFGELPRG
jgi:carboxymethylenebutenolidase